MTEELMSRRPLTSRDKRWARRFAAWLKDQGVRPNSISVMSVAFAALGGAALIASAAVSDTNPALRIVALLGVGVGVMGRLLCNLFDGMVAVEGGLKTASGEIFNDLPDRLSDLLIFAAMGYSAATGSERPVLWSSLGWLAASLAVLTAYIRYLGAGCGVGHFFMGPMAKQHRMATTLAACVASAALEPWALSTGTCFRAALVIIAAGSAFTCVRRVRQIARKLEEKAKA